MAWRNYITFIIFVLLFLSACTSNQDSPRKLATSVSVKLVEVEQKEHVKWEQAITLSAIGDMLIHARVYDKAEVADGYDFMPMLKKVKPYLNDTTITFANQETMIG